MIITGIDLSLACTGLALIADNGEATTWSIKSTGKATDTLTDRANRIEGMASQILSATYATAEVIIESPSYGSSGSGTWDRAGLWWAVVSNLTLRGVPLHTVAPATVKKWITGTGRAEKNTVGVHIGRLFPDVEIHNDDEADALALAHIAAVRAGYDVPKRAGHTPEGWKAVKWATTGNQDAPLRPLASTETAERVTGGESDVIGLRGSQAAASTTGAK